LDAITPRFDEALARSGPHFRYVNSAAYGYATLFVDAAGIRVQFVETGAVDSPQSDGRVDIVGYFIGRGWRNIIPLTG
jgi:hypothetical protein